MPETTTTYDFTGKVSIVTGAAGGIGQAYAEALGRAGASVVVADIALDGAEDVAEGIRAAGGSALAVAVDVSDPASAEVNNAAIFGGMQLDVLLSVDWEYLTRFMAVNQMGALACTRAVFRSMRKRGGGAIVNQSSTAAYMYAGFYGLAKAGVNALTYQLSQELGGQGVRVNAIAPGPIDTEASRSVVPAELMQPILDGLALKRQGQVDDLVGMCLFLLSDQASWVTGHVFNVDGGQIMRA